jgi:hypothetical protein
MSYISLDFLNLAVFDEATICLFTFPEGRLSLKVHLRVMRKAYVAEDVSLLCEPLGLAVGFIVHVPRKP